jgi:hypothetical protein
MKKIPQIISDPEIYGTIGYLINGKLHISESLHETLHTDKDFFAKFSFIDTDEINYRLHLNKIKLFAGQQVHVFDQGFCIGDGTITDYPYNFDFGLAEVCLHFPLKGEICVIRLKNLVPVC